MADGAVAISRAGEVYAVGKNTHGRFGGDAPDELSEFTRISFFQGKNVTDVAADPVRDTLLFVVGQREGYASGEQIDQNATYADFTKLFEYSDVQTVQFAQSLVYVLADQAVRYYGVCRNGLCGVDEDGREIVDSENVFNQSWRKLNLPFRQTVLRTIQTANDSAFVVTVKNEVYALGGNAARRLCAEN